MKTNRTKRQILLILYEVVALSFKKIIHLKKKSAAKKFHFSIINGEKNAKFEDFRQNDCVFTKATVKNYAFQKSTGKKKSFVRIGAYLCSQFKRNSCTSKK